MTGISERQARSAARAVLGSLKMGSDPQAIRESLAFSVLLEWSDWDADPDNQRIVNERIQARAAAQDAQWPDPLTDKGGPR